MCSYVCEPPQHSLLSFQPLEYLIRIIIPHLKWATLLHLSTEKQTSSAGAQATRVGCLHLCMVDALGCGWFSCVVPSSARRSVGQKGSAGMRKAVGYNMSSFANSPVNGLLYMTGSLGWAF